MSIEITMPRLSDTMEEGTLIKWRVAAGDQVQSGDLLADVETDKATMELQSYDDGTVAELSVDEGKTLPVGARILVLAEKGESIEDAVGKLSQSVDASATAASSAASGAEGTAATGVVTVPSIDGQSVAGSEKIRISPLAKKLAEEHGVPLARIRGTGPGGRIIKRDVLAAAGIAGGSGGGAATAVPTPSRPVEVAAPASGGRSSQGILSGANLLESKLVPVSNMRKTIARRLVESKATIPHFTVTVEIGMDKLIDMRSTLNKYFQGQPDPAKLSVNDFVVRAAALALTRHPYVNASWTNEGIQLHGSANVGVAVAIPMEKGGGLVVPTIRDAQDKSMRVVSGEVRRLAEKARTGGLTLDEMTGGTFTISNLGMLGVEHFEAIINPPQVAILAVGAAIQKPVVQDGRVVLGSRMTATLSADHRVVDGAMAAEFLRTVRELLENPALLLV